MITVSQYLVRRFTKSNALTFKEAKIIGLPWPLKKGWPKKYGDFQISDVDLPRLDSVAEKQKSSNVEEVAARKERKRLNKMVKAGAITREDAEISLKDQIKTQTAPCKQPNQTKTCAKDGFYESREWREIRYKALTMHGGAVFS